MDGLNDDEPAGEFNMDMSNNSLGSNYAPTHSNFTFSQFVPNFNATASTGDIFIIAQSI